MRSISSFRAVYKKCTMRFLIVATAVFACAAAVPAVPLVLAPAQPTISAGDISGAAIEAQVAAADQLTAAVDADRQISDKVSELRGQAINIEEERAWRAVDAVKTIEARLDGAAASSAPVVAKSLVRTQAGVPVSYAAPAYAAAPVAYAADPVAYASAPVAYASAPAVYSTYSIAPSVYSAYSAPLNYIF